MALNIYKILKLALCNKIPMPLRLLGVLSMHILGHRTIAIFMDPILACNLRCRMCYFSDDKKNEPQ